MPPGLRLRKSGSEFFIGLFIKVDNRDPWYADRLISAGRNYAGRVSLNNGQGDPPKEYRTGISLKRLFYTGDVIFT